jgi:4-hydroxybenzoate polyprenyltransferase
MSNRLQNILVGATKILSLVAGLSAYQSIIPSKYIPVAVLVFALASTAKEAINILRDFADDGEVNQSVKD